jgi:hypothetical protein
MHLPLKAGIVLYSSATCQKYGAMCLSPIFLCAQKVPGVYSSEVGVQLLKLHRILIASGIAVCLLYAGREVINYTNMHSVVPLMRAAISVAAAAALGVYLRSIRTL